MLTTSSQSFRVLGVVSNASDSSICIFLTRIPIPLLVGHSVLIRCKLHVLGLVEGLEGVAIGVCRVHDCVYVTA